MGKTEFIRLRVTEIEKREIFEKAAKAGLSVSDFIRKTAEKATNPKEDSIFVATN